MRVIISLASLLFILEIPLKAQQDILVELEAYIIDEDQKPIAFATISSKMERKGTISRKDGKFSISVFSKDTLYLSAVSYEKLQISASQILNGDTVFVMKKKLYMLQGVDVMALRWHDFKNQVMSSSAKEENKKVIQIPGLPNIYRPTVKLSPYAGMTNPVSILLTYFSKSEITKRKQERWRKIYKSHSMRKSDSSFLLKKIEKKDTVNR